MISKHSESHFAKPTRNSKLIWIYDNNNKLINDRPFNSISLASKFSNLNRKSIAKFLDTNILFKGFKFYSKLQ